MADKPIKKEEKSDTIDFPRPGTSKDPDWGDGAWGWSNTLDFKPSCSPMSLVTVIAPPVKFCPSDSSVKVNLLELSDESNNPSNSSDRTIYIANFMESKLSDDENRIRFKIHDDDDEDDDDDDKASRTLEEILMNVKQVKFGDVPPMKETYIPTGVPFNPRELESWSDGEFSSNSEEPQTNELPQNQFERAQKEFQEEEDYYSLMFRPREWKKRKHFAILNFYEPVSMVTPKSTYLLYNTPVQILTYRPHPLDEETIITYGIAVYIKPETLNTSHLYACEGAPMSLTCETKPVYRNVFELMSPQKNMEGLPIQFRAVVYIKLFDKDQQKYFYLTSSNMDENDKGNLFVTETLDKSCEFEILPNNAKDNWKCANIDQEMYIRHIMSGTFVVAKISETVFNIFGEEKGLEAGNSSNDKMKRWTFSHGLPFEASPDYEEAFVEQGSDSDVKMDVFEDARNVASDEVIFKTPKPVKNKSQTYF